MTTAKSADISIIASTSPMGALLLPYTTPLQEAIWQFASDASLHGIFLVDDQQHLVGVINNTDLLDWARLQFDMYGKDYKLAVHKTRRLLMAKTIGDLALPDSNRMSVSLNDSVETALQKMSRYQLEDIAVVDATGKIVNDLRLSELLNYALKIGGHVQDL